MNYYINENGQQYGPFTIDQLRMRGITRETPVWCEGMSQWALARNIPELIEILQPTPPQQPSYQQQYHNQRHSPYRSHIPQPATPCPDNHMALAIVSTIVTVFMCFPFCIGVVSLIYACNVENKWRKGDQLQAESYANNAKLWGMWSLIATAIAFVIYIGLYFALGAFYLSLLSLL